MELLLTGARVPGTHESGFYLNCIRIEIQKNYSVLEKHCKPVAYHSMHGSCYEAMHVGVFEVLFKHIVIKTMKHLGRTTLIYLLGTFQGDDSVRMESLAYAHVLEQCMQ